MSEPFIGEIRMVGFNYSPERWADCDGQLVPVSQNPALFALLGTTYGGDGVNNFALPDLRGRVPINVGTGPGLTQRKEGQKGGQEQVALQQTDVGPGGRTTTKCERRHKYEPAQYAAVPLRQVYHCPGGRVSPTPLGLMPDRQSGRDVC